MTDDLQLFRGGEVNKVLAFSQPVKLVVRRLTQPDNVPETLILSLPPEHLRLLGSSFNLPAKPRTPHGNSAAYSTPDSGHSVPNHRG